jgi:formate dehydrogenase major subunit
VNVHTGKAGYAEPLAGIAVQLAGAKKAELDGLSSMDESDEVKAAAKFLGKASKLVIVYGKEIAAEKTDKAFQAIQKIADLVTKSGGNVSILSPKGEANSYASFLYGMEKPVELGKGKSTFVVLADDVPSQSLAKRLEGGAFLAVQASYASPITAMADVVLPVEMWAEQQGHYLNQDGRLQEAHPSIKASDGILSSSEAMKMIADAMEVKLDSKWESGLQKELSLTKTLE